MVLDSLSGSHTKEEKSSQVGKISKLCAQLARDNDKEVIAVHHLRKRGADGQNVTPKARVVTLDEVRGSTTIVQTMRLIMAIDRPTGSYRRLNVIKSNIGVFPEPIGFDFSEDATLMFYEIGESKEVASQKQRAIEILNEMLKKGPQAQKLIFERIAQENISSETARRAKKTLEVTAKKVGNRWYWLFAEHLDHLDQLQ